MKHATDTDIVGYTYRENLYCPGCITHQMRLSAHSHPLVGMGLGQRDPERWLDEAARRLQIDQSDETTFDSGEFPKVVFRSMLNQSDECLECGDPSYTHPDVRVISETLDITSGHNFVDPGDRCTSCGELLD